MVKGVFKGTALSVLMAAPVYAAEPSAPEVFSPVLKMISALALVLGVILLLYALMRRGMIRVPGAKESAIEIVEMRPLGPKKSLCLVSVRGEELLLGVGTDRVELLTKLKARPAESFEEVLAKTGETP